MTDLLEKNDSAIGKTNSVIDRAYLPKKTSSSIYPDLQENLIINYRKDNLYVLAKDLLPIPYQGSSVIGSKVLLNSLNWIIQLKKITKIRQLWWSKPLVNIVDSEIILEWWHNDKKITVYISSDTAEFIKVWGADIDTEMEEGVAETDSEIEALWRWIAS